MKILIQFLGLIFLSSGAVFAQPGVHNFFSTTIDDDLTDDEADPIMCRDTFQLDVRIGLTTNPDYIAGTPASNPTVVYDVCFDNLMPASFDGGNPVADDLTLTGTWASLFSVTWNQSSATSGCFIFTQNGTLQGNQLGSAGSVLIEIDVVVPDIFMENFTSMMSGTWITVPEDESANGELDNQDTIEYNGFCDQNILPVDWVSFDANPANEMAHLDWAVANQYNASHFEVERSEDGQNFEPIGRVMTADQTSQVLNYEFYDVDPMSDNYYRLKQVDLDGAYTYSVIRVVSFERSEDVLAVFPNPAKDQVNVEVAFSKVAGASVLTVLDPLGRLVKTVNLSDAEFIRHRLDISDLAAGLYSVQVANERFIATRQLEVLR